MFVLTAHEVDMYVRLLHITSDSKELKFGPRKTVSYILWKYQF